MFKATTPIHRLSIPESIYFLAWTTTPWTLPSNTALAVGNKIEYAAVRTWHPYPAKREGEMIVVILASELLHSYFPEKNSSLELSEYKPGDKQIPYEIIAEMKGSELLGVRYEQLLPFVKPAGEAFKVVHGDFVSTTDGTGIVHIAPSFGSDDFEVARQNNLASLTLVDKTGRFLPEVKDRIFLYGGEFVKEAYLNETEKKEEFEKQKDVLEKTGKIRELKNYLSVDERIILKLQEEGRLFKKE